MPHSLNRYPASRLILLFPLSLLLLIFAGCDRELGPDNPTEFSGVILDASTKAPIAGMPVELYGETLDFTQVLARLDSAGTDAKGAFSFVAEEQKYGDFQLRLNRPNIITTENTLANYFGRQIDIPSQELGESFFEEIEVRPAGVLSVQYSPIAPGDTIFFVTPLATDSITSGRESLYYLQPDSDYVFTWVISRQGEQEERRSEAIFLRNYYEGAQRSAVVLQLDY